MDVGVRVAASRTLSGEKRGLHALMPFLGPAFIASVAYVDPGNFATNMAAGAQFGYALGWVVLTANLMAMLVQGLSAKLGIATGRSLPEVCRDRLPHRLVVFLWLQAELVAMATDLAEFTGAALGLHLVFGLPMWMSVVLAGLATFAVLAMEASGFRRLEAAITVLVGVVVLAFCLELLVSRPPASAVAGGVFEPTLPGGSALLAVSIVGATVMPHVIYLHSALVRGRVEGKRATDRRRIFRFEIIDVLLAMSVAGVINLAMLATAAAVFFSRGDTSAGGDLGRVVAGLERLPQLGLRGGARGHHIRGGAAGVRDRVVLRGDDVRADRDGRFPAAPDSAVPAARRDHDPGARRARARVQPDEGARPQPGVPVLRHPVRVGAAGHLHP